MNEPSKALSNYISAKIDESPEGFVAAQVVILGMQPISGAVRKIGDDLFEVMAMVQTNPNARPLPQPFAFTADKLCTIGFMPEEISPDDARPRIIT